jgi:hypothetical protein
MGNRRADRHAVRHYLLREKVSFYRAVKHEHLDVLVSVSSAVTISFS